MKEIITIQLVVLTNICIHILKQIWKKAFYTEESALALVEDFFLSFNKDSDLYVGVQQGDNGQSVVLGGIDKIVQVQTINEDARYLFASKHREKIAAELAAEFLYSCLKGRKSKNILLITGSEESMLHSNAETAFSECLQKTRTKGFG